MAKKSTVLLPKTLKKLSLMGEQIKLARLRRNITEDLVAERSGLSRATVWKIEKGDPSVSMGAYASVLIALGGLDDDLLLIAKDDQLGRTLQDLGLKVAKRVR